MFKLLIVEDEQWVREGLAELLDWSRYHILLAGTAANGQEGLRLAREVAPDIIITDIRMPIFDGISMAKEIRAFLPDAKIIVLTGYDDFKYAKEAIGFRAAEYLLKPINENEFEKVIKKATAELEERDKNREIASLLNEQVALGKEIAKQKYFMELLNSKDSDVNLINKLEETGVAVSGGPYTLAVLHNDVPFDGKDGIEQYINQLLEDKGFFAWSDPAGKELYICMKAAGSGEYRPEADLCQLKDGMYETFNLNVIICYCEPVMTFQDLNTSYQAIQKVMGSLLVFDKGRLVNCDNYLAENGMKGDDVQNFILQTNFYTKQILNSLKNRDTKRVSNLLEELLSLLERGKCLDKNLIINLFSGLISETCYVLTMINENPEMLYGNQKDPSLHLPSIKSFGELKNFISDLYFHVLDVLDSPKGSNDHRLVQKMLDIIAHRYFENISVETIAAELYISAYYLGYLFKKSTGKFFNDYLLEVRMEKAIKLLSNPKNKVSKVAEMVGIPNQSYFGSLFKRQFGMSPGDYKNSIMNGEGKYVSEQ